MKTWAHILAALERHGRCALVSVVKTEGSAPRDAGARMVVTPEGFFGTIGGGTLEWRAIAAAQAQLAGGHSFKLTSHALGPDLGQCCGGRVQLATEVFDLSAMSDVRSLAEREATGPFTTKGRIVSSDHVEHFGQRDRRLYLFGAGHVGRALVLAMAQLPFEILWIDPRPAAFPGVAPANVRSVVAANPVKDMNDPPSGSFTLVMTHSHALDLAVTEAALRDNRFAYVGLIGSSSKRARFEHRLRAGGIEAARIASLVCPIGIAGIESKEPAVIAAATAAQLLVIDEALKKLEAPQNEAHAGVTIVEGARA
jgi:xanthine dehydrogenase accessory factor